MKIFFQYKNEQLTPSSIIKSKIPNDLKLVNYSANKLEMGFIEKLNFIHIPKNGGNFNKRNLQKFINL